MYMYGQCNQWIDKDRSHSPSLDTILQQQSPISKNTTQIGDTKDSKMGSQDAKNPEHLLMASQCVDCNLFKNCNFCLEHLNCGWYYNEQNPTIGLCIKGSFDKPFESMEDLNNDTIIEKMEKYSEKMFHKTIYQETKPRVTFIFK